MKPIEVTPLSLLPHNAQILTGFRMLQKQGWNIQISPSAGSDFPAPNAALVRATYLNKTIFYDLWDGYHLPDKMRWALDQADFYFKRSDCPEKNQALFPEYCHKIYPLGFNYHVTFPGTPFAEPLWKAATKQLLGRVPNRYFTPNRFEGISASPGGAPKILFLTRLWDDQEPGLPESVRQERIQINRMRIDIIRALKQGFGDLFTGGLNDTPLSRKLAPDLIVSPSLTERKQYLRTLHSHDICIASTGLHDSIGWKTGEYVAAAKAIVSEPLRYQVPGQFQEGTHYLSYTTTEECLNAVQTLLADPHRLLAMKKANELYYQTHLRPDILVKNTLEIVARSCGK